MEFYKKHHRVLPVLFFIVGFLWDALTLKRIDSWLDHLVLSSYLAGLSISLWLVVSRPRKKNKYLRRVVALAPLLLQFFLGGLFSAYVVFFFKSASSLSTYIYLVLLIAFLFGNEILRYKKSTINLLAAVYMLAVFSYLCFAIPVLFRSISWWTFGLSLVVSLVVASGFWHYLWTCRRIKRRESKNAIAITVLTAALIVISYFGNLIPPVPISLKVGGVYNQVEKNIVDDKFEVRYEEADFALPWEQYNQTLSYSPGDTIYCFTAVFAPLKLETKLIHRWQKQQDSSEIWETSDELPYTIVGGREEGYRGFTFKRNISPGKWRVDIITESELIVGRLPFEIIEKENNPSRIKTKYY